MSNATSVPTWTLADRLTKARTAAGLDQNVMAAELGVSRAAVSKYERGFVIREGYLKLWALRCNVPYHWLKWGIVDPAEAPNGGGTVVEMAEPAPGRRGSPSSTIW